MNILRKLWQWLCRVFDDSVRIFQREVKARKDDFATITKEELGSIARTQGKHFFLGGLTSLIKRRLPNVPYLDVVKVGYEDCFESHGVQPIATLGRFLNPFWNRLTGKYYGSPLISVDFSCM